MRNSKKGSNTTAIIIGLALVAIVAGGIFVFMNKEGKKDGDEVVAHINGKPVYLSEANLQIGKITQGRESADFDSLDEQSKLLVVKQLAANKIILAEANKSPVGNQEDVKQKIADAKDKIKTEAYLLYVAKNAITDEKIKEHYDSLSKDLVGKTQYRAQHILVKSESAANEALNKLKTEPFEKVAKSDSLDNQTSQSGGELGFLLSGSMVKEFEDAISHLSVGEVSQPFKTKFGWHVVKLEEKRPAEALPLDKIKDSVAKDMYGAAAQEYIKGIVEKAEVELVDRDTKKDTSAAEPAKTEQTTEEKADAKEEKPADKKEPAKKLADNSNKKADKKK
jgi:peptidyl-prolyl cis-trans isomerase C